MSVVIPVTGFLLQRMNTRPIFIWAMSLFSLGTLIAAAAPNLEALIVARVIQASGTAIMMPLLMTTAMTLAPPETRGKTMGFITTVISVAPAIGPTISGVILNYLSWRWMFLLVLPISLGALALGARRILNVTTPHSAAIDVISVVLSGFAFGGLVYGLSTIGAPAAAGTLPAGVWCALGALLLVVFIFRQLSLQKSGYPLLDLRTFGSRNFTVSVLLMASMMMALFGTIILLPIYLQNVLGLSTLQTGLLLLPGGLLMGLLGPHVGHLYDQLGPSRLLVPGVIIVSAVLWAMTLLGPNDTGPLYPRRTHRDERRLCAAVHAAVHGQPVIRQAKPVFARQRGDRHPPAGCGRCRRRVVRGADVCPRSHAGSTGVIRGRFAIGRHQRWLPLRCRHFGVCGRLRLLRAQTWHHHGLTTRSE